MIVRLSHRLLAAICAVLVSVNTAYAAHATVETWLHTHDIAHGNTEIVAHHEHQHEHNGKTPEAPLPSDHHDHSRPQGEDAEHTHFAKAENHSATAGLTKRDAPPNHALTTELTHHHHSDHNVDPAALTDGTLASVQSWINIGAIDLSLTLAHGPPVGIERPPKR
jgi:hypothetical protein